MQSVKEQENEGLLSLQIIFEQFLRRWYIIAIIMVVSLIVSTVGIKLMMVPQYSSTARLYILNTSDDTVSNTSEITISTYLARDYAELVSDRIVLDEVIDNLNLDYSYGALKGCVAVEGLENTRWIEIAVTTSDPKLSKRIADNICEVSQEKIVELMGISRVNIMGEASLPTAPIRSVTKTGIIYGMVLGLLISGAVLVFFSLTDDKIKGVADVERYLGITVLGTIPFSQPRSRTVSTVGRNSAR